MIITKHTLKILKYVYKKKSVSYNKVKKKFSKDTELIHTLDSFVFHQYLCREDEHPADFG